MGLRPMEYWSMEPHRKICLFFLFPRAERLQRLRTGIGTNISFIIKSKVKLVKLDVDKDFLY